VHSCYTECEDQTSQTSWTVGSDTIPDTLYVGGAAVGDLVFTLVAATSNPTTTPATTKGTIAGIHIETENVPNDGNPGDDWNGKTENWLVGQMVDLKAVVEPQGLGNPTYSWTIDGTVFKNYTLDSSPTNPTLTSLASADLSNSEVSFFWTDTGNKSVKCNITLNGMTYTGSVTFNVQAPSVNVTTQTGTIATGQDQNGDEVFEVGSPQLDGFNESASVTTPYGFNAGQWTFLQVVTSLDHIHSNNTSYYEPDNSNPFLDVSFPVPVGPSGSIKDASGTKVNNPQLPTDGTTYTFVDTPQDDLTKPFSVSDRTSSGYGAFHDTTIDGYTRNENYDAYVMFKPAGTNSVWIALRVVHWSWAIDMSVVAHNANGSFVWGVNSQTEPTAGPIMNVTNPPYDWHNIWQESWLQS
jgi:hypothetical protein